MGPELIFICLCFNCFKLFGANHSLERIFSVSDADAIRSDWENVGLDLRTAMEICYKNEKEQGKVL